MTYHLQAQRDPDQETPWKCPEIEITLEHRASKLPKKVLPMRSAYQFYAVNEGVIPKNCNVIVDTFVRVKMPEDYVLLLYSEPEMALEHLHVLNNQHYPFDKSTVCFNFYNGGKRDLHFKPNDVIGLGIFVKEIPLPLNLASQVKLKNTTRPLKNVNRKNDEIKTICVKRAKPSATKEKTAPAPRARSTSPEELTEVSVLNAELATIASQSFF